MREFDFPLDPAETLAIHMCIEPPRVPARGEAVYRMATKYLPLLEENGWEVVGSSKRNRHVSYFRSPGGVRSKTFEVRFSIPTDEAILRLAAEFKRCPSPVPGPGQRKEDFARLGRYIRASFYPWGGMFNYFQKMEDGTQSEPTKPPCLRAYVFHFWVVHVFWPNGIEMPHVWGGPYGQFNDPIPDRHDETMARRCD
jgi:hypothetical protein